ncbi:hypothetical protein BHM03_00035512 [Ensete ventricosum]|nr:hypothetical protein BHM03_00035512 [Ensete ventricosum]
MYSWEVVRARFCEKKPNGHRLCAKSLAKSIHEKSYEHGFTIKRDGHKLCAKSRTKSSFDRFFMKFRILAIPDVLAHGKTYEHGFAKKTRWSINFVQSLTRS